jgi:hypothetical protein
MEIQGPAEDGSLKRANLRCVGILPPFIAARDVSLDVGVNHANHPSSPLRVTPGITQIHAEQMRLGIDGEHYQDQVESQ